MKDKSYRLEQTGIDFLYCTLGEPYRIVTALNGNGNIYFKGCVPEQALKDCL